MAIHPLMNKIEEKWPGQEKKDEDSKLECQYGSEEDPMVFPSWYNWYMMGVFTGGIFAILVMLFWTIVFEPIGTHPRVEPEIVVKWQELNTTLKSWGITASGQMPRFHPRDKKRWEPM